MHKNKERVDPIRLIQQRCRIYSMKGFYLVGLLLCLTFQLWAQEAQFTGRIRTQNKEAVGLATVQLKGTPLATVADVEGKFSFPSIPFGPYLVEISSVEIEKSTFPINIQQKITYLDFTVNSAEHTLSEVRITEKSRKKEEETKGFAVQIIEMKEIADRNIQINEALDLTAGVRVRQNGGLGSGVQYNLNGMSGNSVRIFIDGIPISTYGESFSLNSIPPALIDRIEVYKGVIPAHLADDALGGAIQIILKKNSQNQFHSSLSYGSFQTWQSQVTGQYRSKKSGLTIKVAGFHNQSENDYEVWGKFVRNILPNGRYEYVRARRFNDAYRSSGLHAQLGFTEVKWADQFFIGLNVSEDYKEIQHGTYMSIPYMGRFTEAGAHVMNLSYLKSNFLVKGLQANFNGMYSQRSQAVVDTVKWNYNWHGQISLGLQGEPILRPTGAQQGEPTILEIDRSISTFRTGLSYDVSSRHRVVWNHLFYNLGRHEQDFMRSEVERSFVSTRGLTKNISSFAHEWKGFQTRWQGNLFFKRYNQSIQRQDPRVRIVNGQNEIYVDRAESIKKSTGFGIATSWALTKQWTALFSAEKAIRLPAENEVFGNPGDNIIENFGIRPEVSYNLNIGLNAGNFYWGPHMISFKVNGFIRDSRDKIVQRINPRINDAVQTNPYDNLGKTKAIGWESDILYQYKSRIRTSLGMSHFKSVFNIPTDPNGRPYDYFNRQLPNEPFWTTQATAQYKLPVSFQKNAHLTMHYAFRFVERFYTTWLLIEDFRTPRQFIHDIGLSYAFPDRHWIVSLDAKNLLDRQVYDNFAVQKPGRAIYLKINYQFHSFTN